MSMLHRRRLAAPAKINLGLEILGRDPAGYHRLETVFQTLELADTIDICWGMGPQKTQLSCSDSSIPTDASNLVHQAIDGLRERGLKLGTVRVHIEKRIPAGGGLGGGSSNAGSILRALGHGLGRQGLAEFALQLGADVPFFLVGGSAWACNRGEDLSSLPDLDGQLVSCIFPPFGCATGQVFQALSDRERQAKTERGRGPWQQLWRTNPQQACFNRLSAAASRIQPALIPLLAWLHQLEQPAAMSGSGSTLYVLGPVTDVPAGCRVLETRFRKRCDLDRV